MIVVGRYPRELVFENINIRMESYCACVYITLKDKYILEHSVEMTLTFDSTRSRKVAEDSHKVMDSTVTLFYVINRRCWE